MVGTTPEEQEAVRAGLRPLYDHLAKTADQFWVAESGDKPVGYARSIHRGWYATKESSTRGDATPRDGERRSPW
jgi:hypothetical protein